MGRIPSLLDSTLLISKADALWKGGNLTALLSCSKPNLFEGTPSPGAKEVADFLDYVQEAVKKGM
jgi:hypothetical protein